MICFKKIFKCIYYLIFIYENIIYIFPEMILLLTLNMAFEFKKSYLNECIRSYHRLTKNVELTTTPFPMGIQKASHVLSFRIPSAKAQMCERKKQVVVGVLVVPAIVFFFFFENGSTQSLHGKNYQTKPIQSLYITSKVLVEDLFELGTR